MKKYLVSLCAAFAMFSMISCGSKNVSIVAAEAFLADPTAEKFEALTESFKELDQDEAWEYQQWLLQHQDEFTEATTKMTTSK